MEGNGDPGFIVVPMSDAIEAVAQHAFGMTMKEAFQQGICIDCKRKPVFHSEAAFEEYKLSALCEPCFNKITREPDE